MKRPVAEIISLMIKPGAPDTRMQMEHEAWQILRRKPGYVTHRIYRKDDDALWWLVYAEWESRKGADGARRYLQNTPLMRRARAALAAAPERRLFEIVGPITSTKGLDLPADAVAALGTGTRPSDVSSWRTEEDKQWDALASLSGHITHVRFRGFDDDPTVGALSHWADDQALDAAIQQLESRSAAGDHPILPYPLAAGRYRPVSF